jgi:localization factor PodJL
MPAARAPAPQPPEDHRPLEPGSGKPDLAALRELARSATSGDRTSDRKADFIAAARRAAQAAAAEAALDMDGEPAAAEEKPGTFARIGQAIRNRKRPLLLAAAALVLAISAIQFFDRAERSEARSVPPAPVPLRAEPPAPAPLPVLVEAAPSSPEGAMPRIGGTVVAPPTHDPGAAMVPPTADPDAAIAFAAPERVESQFGKEPVGPSASGFERRAPTTPTAASAPAAEPSAAAPAQASLEEPGIGPAKLRHAAATGDPAAAFEIAARYAEGNGTRRDVAMAAEWYHKAAEAGLAVAQYRLGSLYERGQGVKQDLAAAVVWYQHAADQGNVGAMHNLAVMMSEGVDGAPDNNKAFEWFHAAANYGVKDSQYNLAVLYARGLGAKQDLVESYKWFAVAAAAGDKDAGLRRDEVAKALSPDDLIKARAATKAWQATPVITEANTVATPAGGWDGATAGVTDADSRALVKTIQTLLAEQGYDPGPADGFEGPKTRDAVRAFQRTIGMSETGQISAELADALARQPT